MKIEKDIPLPDKPPRKAKYPFNKMEVGESIFFKGSSKTVGNKPYRAAITYGHRSNKKFTSRPEEGGLRVWRVA